MGINVDNSAVRRIEELRTEKNASSLMLRIRVDGGGCSGFQYNLDLTENTNESDIVFDDCIITDDISLPFLEGATIKFEDALIGSDFKIDNPNAVAGCGCGTSFAVKDN